MWKRTRGGSALLAVAVLVAATAGGARAEQGTEVQELRKRIEGLSATAGLSTEEKQGRLHQLEALGEQVEREWRDKDVEVYGRLTLAVCGAVGALNLLVPQPPYLARTFAMRALEKADDMPLDVECNLIRHASNRIDAQGKPITGEALAQLRRQQVSLWLHGMQRVENSIDEHWDPNDPNQTGVVLNYPGAAPDAVAANQKKIANNILQVRARNLKSHWIPDGERFIIGRYMDAPDRAGELQSLLEKYIADAGRRARILDAVRNQKMPEDLQFQRTTQPSQ